MSAGFEAERQAMVKAGRSVLAAWGAGILSTIEAHRNGKVADLAGLEEQAKLAIAFAVRPRA